MLDWLFHPVKDSKPYWLELLPPALTLTLAVLGYWWGFRIWRKQKTEELRIAANQQREISRIDACKAVWALLAYLSEKENTKTVFVTRRNTWYMRHEQATDYIKKVEEVFFTQGHGIFMPKDIRDDIYEFRARVYRILESDNYNSSVPSGLIAIVNQDVIDNIIDLREHLRVRLREEITQ